MTINPHVGFCSGNSIALLVRRYFGAQYLSLLSRCLRLAPNVTISNPKLTSSGVVSSFPDRISTCIIPSPFRAHCLTPYIPDLLFHCELKHLNYVFRVKAPSSSKSLLSSYKEELPDDQEEFDVIVKRFFTDKYTNIMKEQSHVYHYMSPYKNIPHFQTLLNGKHLYFMQFRVLKIKTAENTYEYIITNLPHSFDLEDIKNCYHMRWGCEISFRYLKHANGLLYFHYKKPEFLKQEIYVNLILYNFGIFLANEAVEENRKKKRNSNNKYNYEIDFSSALKTARKFFIRRDSHKPVDIIKLMLKYVHAVKTEFRQFARPLRGIGAIHFGYR